MADRTRSCRTCKHFAAYKNDIGAASDTLGQCRLAPTPVEVAHDYYCSHFELHVQLVERPTHFLDMKLGRVLPHGMSALKAILPKMGVQTLREVAQLSAEDVDAEARKQNRMPKGQVYNGPGSVDDIRRLLTLCSLKLRGDPS